MFSEFIAFTEDSMDIQSFEFGFGRGFEVHQIPNGYGEDHHGWKVKSQNLHPAMETTYTNALTNTAMGDNLSTDSTELFSMIKVEET